MENENPVMKDDNSLDETAKKQDKKKIVAELVERFKQGDNDAYNELYTMYHDQMLRIAIRHTQAGGRTNMQDAEDVVQDAMIKAYQNIQSLDNASMFENWLTRIVTNRAKDYMMSAAKRKNINFTDKYNEEDDIEYDPEDEKGTYQPDVIMEEKTREDILGEIFNDLSEEQRIVTIMHFYDDMTLQEIADELGIEMSTVQGRFQTAKKNIKASVSAIQKRDDIKLYNVSAISAIPFFAYLLGKGQIATDGVASEIGVSTVIEGATNTAEKVGESANASKVVAETAKAASHKIAISAGTKIFVSVAVGLGIVGGGYAIASNKKADENTKVGEKTEKKEKSDKKKKTESTPTSSPTITPTPTIEATTEPTEETQSQSNQEVIEQQAIRTPSDVALSEVESFVGFADGYEKIEENATIYSSTTQSMVPTKTIYRIWCASQGYTTESSADSAMVSYSDSINSWPVYIVYIRMDDSGNLFSYEGLDYTNFVAKCAVYNVPSV